jgi:hypothetical protein
MCHDKGCFKHYIRLDLHFHACCGLFVVWSERFFLASLNTFSLLLLQVEEAALKQHEVFFYWYPNANFLFLQTCLCSIFIKMMIQFKAYMLIRKSFLTRLAWGINLISKKTSYEETLALFLIHQGKPLNVSIFFLIQPIIWCFYFSALKSIQMYE